MAANDNNRRSLRQGLAALANALDHMADQEPNDLYRASARRLTREAREVARREPFVLPRNLRQQQNPPDQQ